MRGEDEENLLCCIIMHNFSPFTLCYYFIFMKLLKSLLLDPHTSSFLSWRTSLKLFFILSGNSFSFLKNWSIWLFILRTYYFLSICLIILPLLHSTFFTIPDRKTKIVLIEGHFIAFIRIYTSWISNWTIFSGSFLKTAL